jgi:acetyl esterase/lipase
MLHLPARDIPIPASVSPQAQAIMSAPRPPMPPEPPAHDTDAWRRQAAMINQAMTPIMKARASGVAAAVKDILVDGVTVYDIVPAGADADDPRIYFDIHGGAYITCFGEACRAQAIGVAGALGHHVWSVDYRTPPDHKFPAPLDDCLTVYRTLVELRGARNIIVGGTSAGANLTASLILRARDEGLPLPAAAIIHTPHLDMTNASDSLQTNRGLDAALSGSDMTTIREVYAGGQDYQNPYLSPLFGDLAKGFPPTFLSTGTRDMFLSDTVRFHAALRAADIQAELHVTEAASHGNFHGAPEEDHIHREVRKFITAIWDVASTRR